MDDMKEETKQQIKHDWKKIYQAITNRLDIRGKELNQGRLIINEQTDDFMSRDFMEAVVLDKKHDKERHMNRKNFYFVLRSLTAVRDGTMLDHNLRDMVGILLDVNTRNLPDDIETKKDFFAYLRFIENGKLEN
jgi:hypothetical protein